MSPNWRSASTSTTGRSAALGEDDGEVGGDHRLAGAALGREHGDDLAEARRRTRSASSGTDARWAPMASSTRRTASPSCAVSTGAASTSRTPLRSARWNRSVVSSSATRIAPTSGRWREQLLGAHRARGARRTTGRARPRPGSPAESLREAPRRWCTGDAARRAAWPAGCGWTGRPRRRTESSPRLVSSLRTRLRLQVDRPGSCVTARCRRRRGRRGSAPRGPRPGAGRVRSIGRLRLRLVVLATRASGRCSPAAARRCTAPPWPAGRR